MENLYAIYSYKFVETTDEGDWTQGEQVSAIDMDAAQDWLYRSFGKTRTLFPVLMGGLLRMRCGAWPAIVISAIVFAAFHGTHIQLLGTTVFGIIAGWLYWRTRSLIPSMIVHMVNNSVACVLEMVAPDYEPGKIASVVFIVAFLPILVYSLKWFGHDVTRED